MRKRIVLAVLLATVLGSPVRAGTVTLVDFAYQQLPGARVPALTLRDEAGREASAAAFADGLPTILALGYFHCPNLCGLVRADLLHALGATHMTAGRDYTLLAVSIDPAETPADAAAAKREDMVQYPLPGAVQGWHYLTGQADAVRALADAVGFRSRFDATSKQFLHPSGLVFLSASGVVSGYLLGVGYAAPDVRLGVLRAASGTVAAAASPVLLLCFHFDPSTGRYTLAVLKLLKLGAALTVLAIGGTLLLAFRRDRGSAP